MKTKKKDIWYENRIDGKYATIRFYVDQIVNGITVWEVTLAVSSKRRWNREYCLDYGQGNEALTGKITGLKSAKALFWAKRTVEEFCKSLGKNEIVELMGEDEHRDNAYRILTRKSGFVEYDGVFYFLKDRGYVYSKLGADLDSLI